MPAAAAAIEEYGFILSNMGLQKHLDGREVSWNAFQQICEKLLIVHAPPGERFARGLLMKNPPDSGRETLILERYPQAKFIYISRNPIHVSQGRCDTLQWLRLRNPDSQFDVFRVDFGFFQPSVMGPLLLLINRME
jgi:hypothetical protein